MIDNVLMRPIGFVRSPYSETAQVPKGFGAQHEAEGTIEILPEYEPGLTDIEGFSHLYISIELVTINMSVRIYKHFFATKRHKNTNEFDSERAQ